MNFKIYVGAYLLNIIILSATYVARSKEEDFHYMTNMAMPQQKNSCPGGHAIYIIAWCSLPWSL